MRSCSHAHAGTATHDAGSPHYDNVGGEVRCFFEERYETLTASGIDAECLCFDPGIGFGKAMDHNLALLARLDELVVRGRPLLIGLSRKSFIGKVLGDDSPALRDGPPWPSRLSLVCRGCCSIACTR